MFDNIVMRFSRRISREQEEEEEDDFALSLFGPFRFVQLCFVI